MARVDSLESQKAAGNFKTLISGTKLLRFVPSGTQYSCVKSAEIKVCTHQLNTQLYSTLLVYIRSFYLYMKVECICFIIS